MGGPDPEQQDLPCLAAPSPEPQWSNAGSALEEGVSPKPSLLLHSQGSPASSPSALLYMNADFEGGEFIFTEMDAKTVTVSQGCEPNAIPQQPVPASDLPQAACGSYLAKSPYKILLAEVHRPVPCPEAVLSRKSADQRDG